MTFGLFDLKPIHTLAGFQTPQETIIIVITCCQLMQATTKIAQINSI